MASPGVLEVEAEILSDSPKGRRAVRVMTEASRDETRAAVTTRSTSAGAFATPDYLTALDAIYRSANRSSTDQCRLLPLPPYGMRINVPSFASSLGVASQVAETAGVAQNDPTGAVLSVAVTTIAGVVNISQQLLERGGFSGDGGSFDQRVISGAAYPTSLA